MGTMNLLTGSFDGKVGKVVGSKWKSLHTIRSAVDGKAPSTATQTAALLAFGSLQRVIRKIQTVIQPTIYNPCPKMTEQNAWVHLSKTAVDGGVFNPGGIKGPKGKLDILYDKILTYNPSTGIVHGERPVPKGWNDPEGRVIWVNFWNGETMLYPLQPITSVSLVYTFSIGPGRTGPIWAISMWQRPGYRTKQYSQLVATVATIVTEGSEIGPQPAVQDINFLATQGEPFPNKVARKKKVKKEEEKDVAKDQET